MGQLADVIRNSIRCSSQSQAEIAENTGISTGIISRFMRGERSINLDTAEKLAAYLRLELRMKEDA